MATIKPANDLIKIFMVVIQLSVGLLVHSVENLPVAWVARTNCSGCVEGYSWLFI